MGRRGITYARRWLRRETRNPEQYRKVFEQFEAAWANRVTERQSRASTTFWRKSQEPIGNPCAHSLESLARRLRNSLPHDDPPLSRESGGESTIAPVNQDTDTGSKSTDATRFFEPGAEPLVPQSEDFDLCANLGSCVVGPVSGNARRYTKRV